MIECTNSKVYTKKNRIGKDRRFFSRILFIIAAISVVLYVKFFIFDEIEKIAYDYANSVITESINKAVNLSMINETDYDDLVNIVKDEKGDIALISANSLGINALNREIVTNTENFVYKIINEGVPIPLMAFTGIKFFSGVGKKINLKILTFVSTDCDFESKFTSVGINQTLHSIYSVIRCNLEIEVPTSNEKCVIESKVLISESVLVGNVPEVYLGGRII